MRAWPLRLAVVLASLAASVPYAHAQFERWGRFREGSFAPVFPPADFRAPSFTFCRLMYTQVRREPMGMGWRTDYPYAEINLMTRMSELTRAAVSLDAQKQPTHYVVRLMDDELFGCPFIMASDAGTIGLSDDEARRLREYLLKGGFLWVDDFWGSAAWAQWEGEIAKALPPAEYPIRDLPLTDPIFRSLFQITKMPQITNIIFWRQVQGQTTSERGNDSVEHPLRAIRDAHGRIMVLMTHNNDVADSWEREGEDPAFFYQFSPDGYALGLNVLMYAMSH
jgi:Domain of unknown function (DUF4159)